MKIRWSSLVKGFLWELLGVGILYGYIIVSTGDYRAAGNLVIGWPLMRALTFYPFERAYKAALKALMEKYASHS